MNFKKIGMWVAIIVVLYLVARWLGWL